jgi:hypothetical protein
MKRHACRKITPKRFERGGKTMSTATLNKLIALCESEEKYTALVESRLHSLGVKDRAMLATIATYYEALDQLASE